MRDKLTKLIEAYEELEKKLVDPAVVSDPKEYARLAKEHASQAELAGKAREYLGALDDIEAAKEMQRETTDPDEKRRDTARSVSVRMIPRGGRPYSQERCDMETS